jgi:hypothetical protein
MPDAFAWARGQLEDLDLLLKAPLVPEGVFLVNLPDRAAYREMLKQVLHWRRAGAVFMITRTGNPVVDDHIVLKNGGRETYRESFHGNDTKSRFILPPKAFNAWLDKFSRPITPDPALPAGAPAQPRRCDIPIPPMSGHRAPNQNAS